MTVVIRDLACFGRPVRLVWHKRRYRCVEPDCEAKTWTEVSPEFSSRSVLTLRAGVEACRQVGMNARPVAGLARELGVCWWTVMEAVIEHGPALVEDPHRVGVVTKLGVDETSLLKATATHSTIYATSLVDLDKRIIIDMVEGNAATDLRRWCADQDPVWLSAITTVATDLAESFRAGLSPHLSHAERVADPFHVIRVANRCVDKVRRRVQNETLGHIVGARPIRSIGSASCCCPAPSVSMSGAPSACCWAFASAIPTTRTSVRGWPKNLFETYISPTTPPRPRCCWTRPSSLAAPMTWRRSSPSATPWRHGAPRSSPTTTAAPATARPRGSIFW